MSKAETRVLTAPAAARTVKSLVGASAGLIAHPRIGEQLDEFSPREVRRLPVGHGETRYEIRRDTITVPRNWHTREEQ
ncbi:type II toxin-antitoxin system RelE/ParE family toxin [Pseudoduganella namucuonensis]|uniref:Uncharacterized protein n=1 Tax=Pseudoduganella namucuonensis TaxID=1035707 RepID=A0A1I7L7W3_9BURK|nr:type II toxin-antitoxin system RelE/ParE family toxin [Pseudoduganella namucuonensis]SFV05872.1 hypothetical protein SAMN05216552_1024100 [Pseudoduganella namucuonensis]